MDIHTPADPIEVNSRSSEMSRTCLDLTLLVALVIAVQASPVRASSQDGTSLLVTAGVASWLALQNLAEMASCGHVGGLGAAIRLHKPRWVLRCAQITTHRLRFRRLRYSTVVSSTCVFAIPYRRPSLMPDHSSRKMF